MEREIPIFFTEVFTMKKRSFADYTIYFIIYACIGWIYEVVLETFIYKWGFSNRGVLFGPWLPVYGFGAVIFIALWYRLIENKKLVRRIAMIPVIFLLTMTTATALELLTSYLCEWTMGSWPWQTYADYSINFQARIALSPSIRFGIGGVVFLYAVQPLIDRFLSKLSEGTVRKAAAAVVSVLAADFIFTVVSPAVIRMF